MGKKQHQSDKLYITHKEWSHFYGGKNAGKPTAEFKKLPWNCCCLSFLPVKTPVCDKEGHMFDLVNIVPYLKQYGTNPVTGEKLKYKDLIRLTIHHNNAGEMHDPVTFKPLTDNSKIVAIATTGNVYLYDSVDRLNIKPKNWKDLVTDEAFTRGDIIVLQDPERPEKQNYAQCHHVQTQLKVLSDEDKRMMNDPTYNIRSTTAEAKATLAEYAEKKKAMDEELAARRAAETAEEIDDERISNVLSDNRAAMSFTSTAAVPETRNRGAVLDRDFVRYEKVKKKGYARIHTNMGDLNIELHCNLVPKTCENFILLAERGYYNNTKFHRLIRNFMIQGGDPTGTGKGGESAWGTPFEDEWKLELSHEGRGILSMANKGPDTNTSQFFITFRSCKHLDKKHTIFGKIVGGMDTLTAMERTPADRDDRPEKDIVIQKITVFVNPFAEVDQQKAEEDRAKKEAKAKAASAPPAELKVQRAGVGKYMAALEAPAKRPADQAPAQKPAKRQQAFGNFSSW